jgi:hypothetical protein
MRCGPPVLLAVTVAACGGGSRAAKAPPNRQSSGPILVRFEYRDGMMITHHRGAIRMARAERRRGKDAHLRKIARAIIRAQSAEIREMNAWRKQWYGATSPSGGVPNA